MNSATLSGSWPSTTLATASGGPITSHPWPKPSVNGSWKRLNSWMCLASSAGELQHRPDPDVVGVGQVGADMVQHERQDEFLDQPEHAEIFVRRGYG